MTELFDLISTNERLTKGHGPAPFPPPYPAEIVELVVLSGREAPGVLAPGTYRYAAIAFSGDGQRAARREARCCCAITEGQKPSIEAYTTDLNTVGFEIYRQDADEPKESTAWLLVARQTGRHITFADDGKAPGEALSVGTQIDLLVHKHSLLKATKEDALSGGRFLLDHIMRSLDGEILATEKTLAQLKTQFSREILHLMIFQANTAELKAFVHPQSCSEGALYDLALVELNMRHELNSNETTKQEDSDEEYDEDDRVLGIEKIPHRLKERKPPFRALRNRRKLP